MENSPAPAFPDSLGPVPESQRIVSLDILRGFAVLGILVMNIQSFSMIGAAYMNPTAFGNLEGGNLWVWILSHLLTDQKFMAIFSMLFGAGIILMATKATRSGKGLTGLHYRRMFWLTILGLVHAYLFWYGDILFVYGICGSLVYWFRKAPPVTLLVIALVLLCIGSGIYMLGGLSMPSWPPEAVRDFEEDMWRPSPGMAAAEIQAYRGSWLDQLEERADAAVGMQTVAFFFFLIWRVTALMLIGMALFKMRVFSAERSSRFYWSFLVLAVVVGLPLVSAGIVRNFGEGWDVASFFLGSQYNYWGSIPVALGWIGLVMLAFQHNWCSGLTTRLAAVGKTALSCYLLETLIATTIFYGHGFGLFGQVSRIGQIGITAGIWIALLLAAPSWLKRFRYGPFEWAWRSLSYWTILPIRRARVGLSQS